MAAAANAGAAGEAKRDRMLAILANEIYAPARRRYPTRHVVSRGVNQIWTMDLAFLPEDIARGKFKSLLVVVDVFSRFAWAEPLTGKTGPLILAALDKICASALAEPTYPKKLWTDQGGEFYNRGMTAFCAAHGIEQYSVYGTSKAAIAERAIRTLKMRLAKARMLANTDAWVDLVPAVLAAYNKAHNTGIDAVPREVQAGTAGHGPHARGDEPLGPIEPLFAVGDKVRLSRVHSTFGKESGGGNWTHEIFTVAEVLPTSPPTFRVRDDLGEVITGGFYNEELRKTAMTDDVRLVANVIKTRRRGGRTESLVRWLGHGPEHDSWEAL